MKSKSFSLKGKTLQVLAPTSFSCWPSHATTWLSGHSLYTPISVPLFRALPLLESPDPDRQERISSIIIFIFFITLYYGP